MAKLHVVIILADDLGNADLGYHGSDIKTPNIDKLANDGVRMESFYGSLFARHQGRSCSPAAMPCVTACRHWSYSPAIILD